MTSLYDFDAVVVGSGPNGLAAAVILARQGLRVQVVEARSTIGGGTRTKELTLPGFRHDLCSAVHPLGVASPILKALPLAEYGVAWLTPQVSAAQPLDGGKAAVAFRSFEATIEHLGADGERYRRLLAPALAQWDVILPDLLAPLHFPHHLWQFMRAGAVGVLPAEFLARGYFSQNGTRALFAGMAGHSILPLGAPMSSAYGYMMLLSAHTAGWPVARGGSQTIADALGAMLRAMGGEIVTGCLVTSFNQLPRARAVLFDTSPRAVIGIAGDRLPTGYRQALANFRLGPGVFKVDWALDAPIPWANELCAKSATVHLGGTMEEMVASERAVHEGKISEHPYVILTQPTLLDETRAPAGKHVAWGYCHVPNGSTFDMTARIEAQVERFAPGFGKTILARHTMNTVQMEAYNPNYIGGDINGGMQDLMQHFARPNLSLSPHRTPAKGIYLCSSSTPPGGGVHGMCGYHAANAVLADMERGRI